MDSVGRRAVSLPGLAGTNLVIANFSRGRRFRSGCRPGSADLLSLTSKAAEPPVPAQRHLNRLDEAVFPQVASRRCPLGPDSPARSHEPLSMMNGLSIEDDVPFVPVMAIRRQSVGSPRRPQGRLRDRSDAAVGLKVVSRIAQSELNGSHGCPPCAHA